MKDRRAARCKGIRQSGFTLIEVMVALCVLCIGILGIASLQGTAIRGNGTAARVTSASNLAQDWLEHLMGLEYTASYTDPDLLSDIQHGGPHVDPNPPQGFSVTWNVTDDSPAPGTKSIVITVTWQGQGAQKSTVLQCIKSRT